MSMLRDNKDNCDCKHDKHGHGNGDDNGPNNNDKQWQQSHISDAHVVHTHVHAVNLCTYAALCMSREAQACASLLSILPLLSLLPVRMAAFHMHTCASTCGN